MSASALLEGVRARFHDTDGGGAATPDRGQASLGAVLDAALPWRGLPCRALHEVSGLAATSAVAAMARRALRRGGSLVWCRDRRLAGELGTLDGAGFARFGLGPERVAVVEADGEAEVVAACEVALRRRGVACAVAEIGRLDLSAGRRLQRAAAAGDGVGLLLRPEFDPSPNGTLTRWRAEPGTAADGISWRLTLWHARGGTPGIFAVRWDERALCFAPATRAG